MNNIESDFIHKGGKFGHYALLIFNLFILDVLISFTLNFRRINFQNDYFNGVDNCSLSEIRDKIQIYTFSIKLKVGDVLYGK